jgi:signal transduction histidine kinase
VTLRVRDDGLGLPSGWDVERDSGVGLRNLRSRLEQIYGRGDLLRVSPVAAGGVEVLVEIPMAPSSGGPEHER